MRTQFFKEALLINTPLKQGVNEKATRRTRICRKSLGLFLGLLLLGTFRTAGAATNDLTSSLQQGLFEEEANHDLNAAIAAYKSVAARFDENRKLAATAIFRLGECYRKQGNTNAAAAQYQRVLREFADQEPLGTLSRQNLAALGSAPQASGTASLSEAARQEQKRLLEEEVDLLKKKLDAQQKQMQVGQLTEDALWETQRQILELRRQIAALDAGVPLAAAAPASPMGAPTSTEAEEVRRIQALIKDSPDLINAPDPQTGYTPLQKAAEKGQSIVAQFLLANGADVEARNPKNFERTALMFASASGHKAMAELLLSRGAKVDATDSNGSTALHLAAQSGFKNIVEVLLARGAQVNAKQKGNNATPLHVAAASGFTAVAELLLSHGAEVNGDASIPNKDLPGTPLHIAARRGDLALTELLLANRADPSRLDQNGLTPLHLAAQFGHPAVARVLLAKGADVDARAGQMYLGWTPLVMAIHKDQPGCVALLLTNRANPNVKFGTSLPPLRGIGGPSRIAKSYTPLLLATSQNATRIVDLLLDAGADPNLEGDNGDLPLFNAWSASSGRDSMLVALLEHGANVDARQVPEANTVLMGSSQNKVSFVLDVE